MVCLTVQYYWLYLIDTLGPSWKLQRKALHTLLSHQACTQHIPIQRAEAIQFVYDLIKAPSVSQPVLTSP